MLIVQPTACTVYISYSPSSSGYFLIHRVSRRRAYSIVGSGSGFTMNLNTKWIRLRIQIRIQIIVNPDPNPIIEYARSNISRVIRVWVMFWLYGRKITPTIFWCRTTHPLITGDNNQALGQPAICLKKDTNFWPSCKPERPLFSAEFVCLCVCVSLTGTSTLQR